jgi:hypothetical protein
MHLSTTAPVLFPVRERHILVPVLPLLRQARVLALAANRDVWDFAVKIGELRKVGLTDNQIRWLVEEGLVEHRVEVTGRRSRKRRFRPAVDLVLEDRSCFVLTGRGCELAALGEGEGDLGPPKVVPIWKKGNRKLWYAGRLVREYPAQAHNLILILTSFQEIGWQWRVNDPLDPSTGKDPSGRLRDAVWGLNAGQSVLVFRADGKGKGVLWAPKEPE